MPTTRKRRTHERIEYDTGMVRVHLMFGDCLLAGYGSGCACGLRSADGELQEDVARALWRTHRAQILATWTGPEPTWAEEQFEGGDAD